MDIFLKDIENEEIITWELLINDINNHHIYNPYCKHSKIYDVFKHIIISLILGQEVILLDSDYSDSELINITGTSNFENFTNEIDKEKIIFPIDKVGLLEKVRKTCTDWKITLFTSGTTGVPKKVSHNFISITRFVKITKFNNKSIWGFAFNPCHMAGIQVFFQALLNGNTIVRLFGLSSTEIHREIFETGITHISATPTFYRILTPCPIIFESVRRITTGGEKLNEKTIFQLKGIFPNAKITNVYASTEAGSLFASENDVFSIRPDLDNLIRYENSELLIHNSLIGSLDININEWYNTGDLIEIINEKPLKFRFLSRKSDIINVGGYKVNPLEVEEAICTFPDIKDVRVFSKSNSVLGNIIICEIVSDNKEINELAIRTYLRSLIQEFKIPRIIRFVDEITTTRTGKIKRH